MITATRILEFDAGHRLLRHEGKCRNVHGHRYKVEVTVASEALDDVGRVIDFGEIKRQLGTWIDRTIDHKFIAQVGDPIIEFLLGEGSEIYLMEDPPTAENIAAVLAGVAVTLLPREMEVVEVIVWETPNCFATWRAVE